MTPKAFTESYLLTAQHVSAGTGIDPYVLLAQWACETGWGEFVYGYNLGNIRDKPGSFARYLSLSDFARACIDTWHNGYYPNVLAAQGAEAQLAAICASPWDAGHYGGSLQAFYAPLEVSDMTPAESALLTDTHNKTNEVWNILKTGKHPNAVPPLSWLFSELEAIKASLVTTQNAGGGLTDAQAGQLTAALQILTKIEVALKGA